MPGFTFGVFAFFSFFIFMAKRLTIKEFIEKSIKKFGKKYDYSKTLYINAYAPVIITCPIHGDFNVIPHSHLKRNYKNHGLCGGCPVILIILKKISVKSTVLNYCITLITNMIFHMK